MSRMSGTTKNHFDNDEMYNQQIRILLFGESGLKGRKLIYDSFPCKSSSNRDICTLTEMVFGSLAIRCYDTCFKVHNLSSPHRIMFTQVFPIQPSRKIQLCSSSFKSTDLLTTNNSLLSTDRLTRSESREMCGCNACDTKSTIHTTDSGFTEQSFYSDGSNSSSSFSNAGNLTISSRIFSKIETEPSLSSVTDFTTGFTEEHLPKSCYKMGLVFIILINTEKEKYRTFCMKHIAYIETVIYRVRKSIEMACGRPSFLVSTMTEISNESMEWLNNILFKARIIRNENDQIELCQSHIKVHKLNRIFLNKLFHTNKSTGNSEIPYGKTFSTNNKKDSGSCFKKFCELIQKLETKERNSFMSNLITSTLTYHLGWVATCLPTSNYMSWTRNSYNALWIQLSELYGALGHPLISCRTIINASTTNNIIPEILDFLKYFIRYSKVEYKAVERSDIAKDNEAADVICQKEIQNIEQSTVNKSGLHRTNKSCFELSDQNDTLLKQCLYTQEKPHFILGDDEEYEYKDTFVQNQEPRYTDLRANSDVLWAVPSKPETVSETVSNKPIYKVKSNFSICVQDFENYSDNPSKQTKQLDSFSVPSKVFCDAQGTTHKVTVSETHEDEENYFNNKNVAVLERHGDIFHKLRLLVFPLPRLKPSDSFNVSSYASILQSNTGKYIPDMAIQGTNLSEKECALKVKKDISLIRHNMCFNRCVDEFVTVVGNLDKWDVKVYSSSVHDINHSDSGSRVEISSLVENMLEVTSQMWNHHLCVNYCVTHIEQRLLEICIHSMAMAHFLLDTDFCVMDLLTSTLHLQVNDIPLLLSVASTVTPQVTKKYGLRLQ